VAVLPIVNATIPVGVDIYEEVPMQMPFRSAGLSLIFIFGAISGCSHRDAANWQKMYDGCKQLATAMAQDHSGLFKTPDCERIPKLCSNDPDSSDCKNELSNYSIKDK
jgi:hypothetical protein